MTGWKQQTLRPPREATKTEASDPKAESNELGVGERDPVTTVEYTSGDTKVPVFDTVGQNYGTSGGGGSLDSSWMFRLCHRYASVRQYERPTTESESA